MRLLATLIPVCATSAVLAAPAAADPDTGRVRVLDCGPAGMLTAVLNPNAFASSIPAFHATDSTAVLVPLNVRVDGELVRSAPGVVDSGAKVVSCSYTDPAGRLVEITGLLTSR